MIIYGRNVILETLNSNLINIKEIFLLNSLNKELIQNILKTSEIKNIPLKLLSKDELYNYTHTSHHQGVAAEISLKEHSWEEVWVKIKHKKEAFILVLDHLQDPHNLGSLIRTACASGIDAVIIPKARSCQITPAVFKVSQGALTYIPVIKVSNLVYFLKDLKKQNFWVIGADLEGKNYTRVSFPFPIALILGGEGQGLSNLVKSNCDILVNIPLKNISSLNVGVAGGIIIFEILKQKK